MGRSVFDIFLNIMCPQSEDWRACFVKHFMFGGWDEEGFLK